MLKSRFLGIFMMCAAIVLALAPQQAEARRWHRGQGGRYGYAPYAYSGSGYGSRFYGNGYGNRFYGNNYNYGGYYSRPYGYYNNAYGYSPYGYGYRRRRRSVLPYVLGAAALGYAISR